MTASHSPPVSAWMVLRACLKAGLLYMLFALAYSTSQPVLTGRLPTLYNGIGPGRVRFITNNEANIDFILKDHIIQQASHDTWNIVMLGSSETYGSYDVSDHAMPMFIDRTGLQTVDGRPARVYNLAYPGTDMGKDLLIADALMQTGLPVDLLVLNVNAWSFSPLASHSMLHGNPEAQHDIITRYHLSPEFFADLSPVEERSFWSDRFAINLWISQQVDLIRWSFLRRDNRGNGPQQILGIETGVNAMMMITRVEGLRAFRQLRETYGVPILLVSVPRTYSQDDFLPWLYIESANTGLPLLDCEFIFGDTALFIDSIHLQPSTDPLYARILAKHFSREEMASVASGLPLRLPEDFDAPEEECVFLQGV